MSEANSREQRLQADRERKAKRKANERFATANGVETGWLWRVSWGWRQGNGWRKGRYGRFGGQRCPNGNRKRQAGH